MDSACGIGLCFRAAGDVEMNLEALLEECARRHAHLCPRQVLGVRMGLRAGQVLGLELPRRDKRLFTFVEIDGCTTDGIAIATGCWVGKRTMRIMDYGKIAATFVDRETGEAIRIRPHPRARDLAICYAPQAEDRWHAYLIAYQQMPDKELLLVEPVTLTISLAKIISQETARTHCSCCGEEIFNEREVEVDGRTLCLSCAGQTYYETNPGENHQLNSL